MSHRIYCKNLILKNLKKKLLSIESPRGKKFWCTGFIPLQFTYRHISRAPSSPVSDYLFQKPTIYALFLAVRIPWFVISVSWIKRTDNVWMRDVSGCSTSDRGKMGETPRGILGTDICHGARTSPPKKMHRNSEQNCELWTRDYFCRCSYVWIIRAWLSLDQTESIQILTQFLLIFMNLQKYIF